MRPGGARRVSRTSTETAVSAMTSTGEMERARLRESDTRCDPHDASLQEVALDHTAALEFLELQGVRCHLKSGIEWEQADQLATKDLHPGVVRATFDLSPYGRERSLVGVQKIHRHLGARWIGQLEAEGLHRGKAPRGFADLLGDALRDLHVRGVELDVERDQ